jgi:hypothetical protein
MHGCHPATVALGAWLRCHHGGHAVWHVIHHPLHFANAAMQANCTSILRYASLLLSTANMHCNALCHIGPDWLGGGV